MPKLNAKALYKKLTDTVLIKIFASAILFYLISCNKKDFRTNDKNNFNTEVKTDVLKGWMNSKISNSVGYEKEFIDSITRIIEWGEIKGSVVSSTKEILYLPLKNSTVGVTFFYDFQSNQIDSCNLVLVKHLNNSKHEFPILGVASYYRTCLLKYKNNIDFTGTVTFYSLTNKFQEDFGFKNGNIFRRGFVAPKLNLQSENRIKSSQQFDDCTVWGHFTIWSDGTISLDYTYLICSDCQTTSVNLRTGNQFLKSNCAGGGGGDPIINYEIWNRISDSCLKALVDRLVNSANRVTIPLAKPLIRDVLSESFFASYNLNSSYLKNKNLVFSINNNIEREAIYTYNPYTLIPSVVTDYYPDTIFINSSKLANASQEYITSVILHEMAHSVLTRHGINTGILNQHGWMTLNYVDQLSLSLRSFHPNLDLNSANSMALQGLGAFPPDLSLLNKYGFNNDNTSSNHWQNLAQQYYTSTLGTPKCDFQ
jgi:hypothetical protein